MLSGISGTGNRPFSAMGWKRPGLRPAHEEHKRKEEFDRISLSFLRIWKTE